MMRSKAETLFCMPLIVRSPISAQYRALRRAKLSRLQYRIDQGRLAGLHFRDGPPQRARNVLGLRNRTFSVPTAGLRELGEIRLRRRDVLADIGALHRR